MAPIARDLNGDSKIDLIYSAALGEAHPGFAVSLGNGDGTFQPATFYQAGNSLYTLNAILDDFNGDGTPDVVLDGNSGIWFFAGKGNGAFAPGVLTPMSDTYPGVVAAGDFNGDRKLDVAVTTSTDSTSFLATATEHSGRQKFTRRRLPLTGSRVAS